jgi:hypothetical protein
MQANLEDVREWMEEGDRLLAQSWDYLAASDADPAQLDLARGYFSRAAHAYLAGAVDFQQGAQAAHRLGVATDDAAQLIPHLDGHLRAEAEAALRSAARHRRPQEARRAAVERAQTLAEELRERFAHAQPELFTRPLDAGFGRTDSQTWSR